MDFTPSFYNFCVFFNIIQSASGQYFIVLDIQYSFSMLILFTQSAVHAGHIKVPPGYHPIDVEKEWGRLHVSILEREKLLRIEFER